ncbi:MAG: arginine deiminase [Spirochaetales bacterium]|uniref:Arginine deiminase n=1 Tax=Candidatus Thalassospirochaeta sargassi TaxID=3119039 RepID=A0AAJ1I9G3_9SPIO|nr:arginine deiminase [Spirochaetales bacterium]
MKELQSSIFNIRSETGTLKTILLHRPGRELEQLIPKYLDEMLFEDIPYLAQMQEEHDVFARTLRERGAEVLYFEKLLADILKNPDVKQSVVDEVADNLGLTDNSLRCDISMLLSERSPEDLAGTLLAGLAKADVKQPVLEKRLSFYIKDDYPFYLDPLPNLYFARDYGTVIGSRLSVNSMKAKARRRESMLLQYIVKNHKRFNGSGQRLWHEYNEPESIEGGDILVLSKHVVAIGCSARTSAEGIENLAARLFSEDEHITEVIVIQIPFTRAYMHLDTVFTMVDRDKFTIFPGITDKVHVFSLTKRSGGITIRPQDNLIKTLSRSLDLPAVTLIETGGGDAVTAEREQWNDSTNTLALAPGTVVTYRRNIVSNNILRKHGIEVVEIPGSELVRGRGGPRCMSMPLCREE